MGSWILRALQGFVVLGLMFLSLQQVLKSFLFQKNVSENPSFFSNHFSIYAQGVFKPSQNFEVYFSGRSSILVEEIGYLVLDKNYSDYFQSYFHAKFFIHDNFSVRLGRLHFESNFDEVLSSMIMKLILIFLMACF